MGLKRGGCGLGNGNAIQTIDLTKCFKTKIPSTGNGIFNRKKSLTIQAIDNLNLEIKQGQLFGLLGPNGAGKTTTQKIIIGLLKDYTGSVELLGKNLKLWKDRCLPFQTPLITLSGTLPWPHSAAPHL